MGGAILSTATFSLHEKINFLKHKRGNVKLKILFTIDSVH